MRAQPTDAARGTSAAADHGCSWAAPSANATPTAAWPDGNELVECELVKRASVALDRCGRPRRATGLTTPCDTADAMPAATRPRVAARRPNRPRVVASTAAATSQIRHLSAARVR